MNGCHGKLNVFMHKNNLDLFFIDIRYPIQDQKHKIKELGFIIRQINL